MVDVFCTSFSCRNRHKCKRALHIEDIKKSSPLMHTNGYCTGFIPVTEACVDAKGWLDRVIDLDFHFF